LTSQINYEQAGCRYIKISPTGILDTINVFKSLQVFDNQSKLHYVTGKMGIRKVYRRTGSVGPFIGLSAFGGILLATRESGHEIAGNAAFSLNDNDIYNHVNWGIEPEIGAKIYVLSGAFFIVSAAYEIG
jgi:hypothetical protein